ncbi:metallophosphoesterase [uncultured Aureimonas sp.]|uniref:metallophosphoesterase n=1 Tax=uncultured Aureimonas sp. TaxID=1604662 RepID=UPI0025D5EBDB|nr:metallophosphoesterase [uncultured Aureimonas sp.]
MTVDEHDDALVDLWNAVVRPGDVVWHLGDFAYKTKRHPQEHFRRLNGVKHLVMGNHDGNAVTSREWASVQDTAEIVVDSVRLFLAHYPHLEWPRYWRQSVHLFGHVHGNREGVGRSCDVGVDAWSYRPVTLDEIMQKLGDRENA